MLAANGSLPLQKSALTVGAMPSAPHWNPWAVCICARTYWDRKRAPTHGMLVSEYLTMWPFCHADALSQKRGAVQNICADVGLSSVIVDCGCAVGHARGMFCLCSTWFVLGPANRALRLFRRESEPETVEPWSMAQVER